MIDEWHRVAADVGASQSDVELFLSEGRALAKTPPSPEQKTQMRADASRQLGTVYGAGADKAIAAAQRLVARDPRLAAMLDRTGLGDSPKVVMRLAELANSQRARGRLA